MANEKAKSQFALPKEVIDRIKANRATIDEAKVKVEALKKLGMDMREIEDRLAWAETAGETIIKEFS